jgi:hypothetical protein
MSFQIYLPCFGETENLGLSSAIRALLLVEEADSERDDWRLRYDGLNSRDIGVHPLLTDAGKLASLYVDRPCRGLRQRDSLFAILNMGGVALFFPGGPLILAQGRSSAGLSEDMVESLGAPVQVDSGEAIPKIVEHS